MITNSTAYYNLLAVEAVWQKTVNASAGQNPAAQVLGPVWAQNTINKLNATLTAFVNAVAVGPVVTQGP